MCSPCHGWYVSPTQTGWTFDAANFIPWNKRDTTQGKAHMHSCSPPKTHRCHIYTIIKAAVVTGREQAMQEHQQAPVTSFSNFPIGPGCQLLPSTSLIWFHGFSSTQNQVHPRWSHFCLPNNMITSRLIKHGQKKNLKKKIGSHKWVHSA